MSADTAIRIKALLAGLLGVITELIGWQGWLVAIYAVFMAIDWITGTQAAKAAGEWSSEVAKAGIRSKGNTLGVIFMAFLLDQVVYLIAQTGYGFHVPLNGTIFAPLVLVWYIFTEAGSIVENAGRNGAPVPDWLAKGIKVLCAKVDAKGEQQSESLEQTQPPEGWEMEHSATEDDEA